MSKHVIQIPEYGIITRGFKSPDYEYLDEINFDKLEQFLLENNSKDNSLEIMKISARKDLGKIIVAQNYVGLISLKNGNDIEILPKIYNKSGDEFDKIKAQNVLLEMIKSLRKNNYKNIQIANVNVNKLDVFEIFIKMFLDEVSIIVKHGLQCDYSTYEGNERYIKGKIDFSKDIKYNLMHKERKYVHYDNYSSNRPENRILKATLKYLYQHTISDINKNYIRKLLCYFDDVDESIDYDLDFSLIIKDRKMSDYENAIIWSKIFLQNKSFTSFVGSEVAFALLFPMDKLFESYVYKVFKQVINKYNAINGTSISIVCQDQRFCLYDNPSAFKLQPDIVIRNNDNGNIYVMDTKWKILDTNKSHYGIAQSDMYQMYIYQRKYNAKSTTLIYPMSNFDQEIQYESNEGALIKAKMIDVYDIATSIQNKLFPIIKID